MKKIALIVAALIALKIVVGFAIHQVRAASLRGAAEERVTAICKIVKEPRNRMHDDTAACLWLSGKRICPGTGDGAGIGKFNAWLGERVVGPVGVCRVDKVTAQLDDDPPEATVHVHINDKDLAIRYRTNDRLQWQ